MYRIVAGVILLGLSTPKLKEQVNNTRRLIRMDLFIEKSYNIKPEKSS
jgi:hypothetical protein